MAKILFAWELGGGMGHLDPMFRIGAVLQERGHEVLYAVRDMARVEARAPAGSAVVQAPFAHSSERRREPALNYADILLRCGYEDEAGLCGLVRAWQQLFGLFGADLVLADHAPTALLAARLAEIPACTAAMGFAAPLQSDPLPSIQPWRQIPSRQLAQCDAKALATINGVCGRLGGRPLEKVADLFDLAQNFLCTFPELDHYGQRTDGLYCGPLYGALGERYAAWQERPGPRIFAYLSAGHAQFKPLMEQLRGSDFSVLVYARDQQTPLSEATVEGNVLMAPRPAAMDWLTPLADLVICHGGHGTCSAVLLGGVPVLMLPQHLEQTFLGTRLAQQGLGAVLGSAKVPGGYAQLLRRMLAATEGKQRVRAFKERYADYEVAQCCLKVAEGIEAIV